MSTNPFDDDKPKSYGVSSNMKSNSWGLNESPISGDRCDMQSQIMDSKTRALASQQRTLRSIANSEQIGAETVCELLEQGETLTRAENQLYKIENLQKESQRQINTLSSVFGGLKNFFSRRQQPSQSAPVKNNSDDPRSSVPSSSGGRVNHESMNTRVKQSAPESEFDENLSQMSAGMSRLKSLAQDMNLEIQTQNDQLSRMDNRIEGVNTTMTSQNRQINKLLGVNSK